MSARVTGLLLLATAVLAGPVHAEFYGMSDFDLLVLGPDGTIGHPADVGLNGNPPYTLKGFTFVDGNVPIEDIVLGEVTMQTISINPGTHPMTNIHDFDLNSFLPRSGQSDPKMYVRNFGGSATWQDTNGDMYDFFLFEFGRNDEFTVQPILAGPDGSEVLGEAVVVPASKWTQSVADEPQIELTRSGPDNSGQRLGGIAFKVTDLKDDAGAALTNSSVILGLVYTSGGMDPSAFFAVAGTPVARNPNPEDGAFVSSNCPVLTWIPGTGTVSESAYLSTSLDDVNDLADAARLPVDTPGSLDICAAGPALTPGVYYWRVLTMNGVATPKAGPIWSFTVVSGAAYNPAPADMALMVPAATTLQWSPGADAIQHTVYLSTNMDDVINGVGGVTTADPSYTPAALQADATYYWRVDESDGTTTSPGAVWSFTTQPAGPGGLTGTYFQGAESFEGAVLLTRVDKVIDFDWANEGPSPAVGLEDFTARWRGELLVPVTGDYTLIATSDDGVRVYVDGVLIISDWSGHAARDAAATVTLEAGPHAIRVEYFQNAGGASLQLSWASDRIVRQIIPEGVLDPTVRADVIRPLAGADEVSQAPRLLWLGIAADAEHDLYLGTDPDAVAGATTGTADLYQGRLGETTYVADGLAPAQTYYWRIDEVIGAQVTKGRVWSFTTAAEPVVDDFENYTDDVEAGQVIWQTWLDGWEVPENGSQVGYAEAPFAEQGIVHGAQQSMPLAYDNTDTATISEAARTFSAVQDWSQGQSLGLWIRGQMPVGSFAYDAATGAYTIGGSGEGIDDDADGFRLVYKKMTGNGTFTARLVKITRFADATHSGIMFRETLEPGSVMVMNSIRAAGQAYTISRATADTAVQTGTQVPPFPATLVVPHWLRLTRQGDVFTAEHSSDGQTWEAVGTPVTVAMAQTVYVGMAVSADQADADQMVNESVFSNVTLQGQVDQAGPFSNIEDVGMAANGPSKLYVAVEDSAGKVGRAVNPAGDQGSQFRDWTAWEVSLAEITAQGVDLTAVEKLTIGLGDEAAASGAGTIYVDDIRLMGAGELPEILAIKPADTVEATGDNGTLLSIDGIAASSMILATTTTDFEKYADHPAAHADDFDLGTYASLDESAHITMSFAAPVTTVFILERGGNDEGFIEPLDAAGEPVGAAQAFAKSDWKKPGLKVNGQDAGVIVITSQMPISGLRVLPPAGGVMGLDPAVVAGAPAQ